MLVLLAKTEKSLQFKFNLHAKFEIFASSDAKISLNQVVYKKETSFSNDKKN